MSTRMNKVIGMNDLFDGDYLNTKILYLQTFNTVPSVNFINRVNGEKAFALFKEKYAALIKDIHGYRWFRQESKKYQFDETVIILKNETIVAFDEHYCEILHNRKSDAFVQELTELTYNFKQRQRREPREINLIVNKRNELELQALEIKRTKLDIGLFYEDDFKETDKLIQKRLNNEKDKGIVLLHGLPGTGKTTYLRYLIGKIKKRVLFLPPSIAENMVSPYFIELLVNYPNSVLIIEDAENIITDRKLKSSSAVSNLLNISDGLLADSLNVQIICTFNSSLTMVDNALLRKGRLIAKYEFGKLNVEKAKRLSAHLGFKQNITEPMTIAEITHPGEPETKQDRIEVIGFRRHETLMN